MRRKHVPQRTCVACRRTQSKRELVRVVRLATGGVVVDPTGKRSGRGAYLCRRRRCWERALRESRLEYALRMEFSEEAKRTLGEFAQSLAENLEEGIEVAEETSPSTSER